MIPLRIVKPCSSGSSAQAVAVGAAIQKVNYKGLFWRDHHFSDKDINHQTANPDIQFPTGYIIQNGSSMLSFLSSLSQCIKIEPTKLCTTPQKHGALYPRTVDLPNQLPLLIPYQQR